MRLRAAFLGIVILALAGGAVAIPRLRGAWSGGAVAPVVLRLTERSTHALAYPPLGEHPEAVRVAPGDRRFVALEAEYRPGPRTRVLAVFEIWTGGFRVFAQAHLLDRLPGQVPIDRPPVWMGTTAAGRRVNILAPQGRVVSGPLTVVAAADDGTVALAVDGNDVVLRPGEVWGQARARYPDGVRVIADGGGWDAGVDAALAAGVPLTVLVVENLGRMAPDDGGP